MEERSLRQQPDLPADNNYVSQLQREIQLISFMQG